jgi:hypothetical protein
MMIKFLKHGSGSGAQAVNYLLEKTKSPIKEILNGNPDLLSATTDSLSFQLRYSSAVLSWAKEDEPTPEQIQRSLNEFYNVAFAGLERDRFSSLAVLHTDADGRKDMHVLIARVDLATGKSFNPAPPGWEKLYGPMRDMLNHEYGWARPDDLLRKRVINLNAPEHIDRKTGKEQITDWLIQRINAGLVTDRKSVIDSLREIGEINRQGKDYVSVKIEGFDKPLRLKGGLYAEQFNAESWKNNSREASQGLSSCRGVDLESAAIAKRQLERVVEARANHNAKRYFRTDESGIGIDKGVAQSNSVRDRTSIEVNATSIDEAISNSIGNDIGYDLGIMVSDRSVVNNDVESMARLSSGNEAARVYTRIEDRNIGQRAIHVDRVDESLSEIRELFRQAEWANSDIHQDAVSVRSTPTSATATTEAIGSASASIEAIGSASASIEAIGSASASIEAIGSASAADPSVSTDALDTGISESLRRNDQLSKTKVVENDTDRTAINAIIGAVAKLAEAAKRIAVATVGRVDRAIEWLGNHVAGRADSTRNFSEASAHIEQSSADFGQSVRSFGKIIDRFDTEGISQKIAVVIRPDLSPKQEQSRGFALGD